MNKKPSFKVKAISLFIFINAFIFFISFIYALLVHTSEDGFVVECAFKNIFNLYCPGCGGSRALLYLFKLDFASAFFAYPPIYVLLFFLVYLDARAVVAIIKNQEGYFSSFNLNILIIIPASILVFFILRNLALLCFGYDYLGDILGK